MPRTDYRIRIGDSVRERLLRNPMAFRLPAPQLDIFVVRNFLDAQECRALIRLIDADRVPSTVLAPTRDAEYRTSESCNLSPADPIVRRVEARLIQLLNIDPELGETIQGQRYAPGQQFKPHHDFFHIGEPYWPEMERTGGQRTWTAMVFLNEPEQGGHTHFPEAGMKVSPVAGNLLAWNNLDAIGEPNPYTLHQGMPVVAGVKYIVTKWHRERRWLYSDMPTY